MEFEPVYVACMEAIRDKEALDGLNPRASKKVRSKARIKSRDSMQRFAEALAEYVDDVISRELTGKLGGFKTSD